MLRRSTVARNYDAWPWPAKLPLKPHWYRHFTPSPMTSVAREVRSVQFAGDCAVVFTLAFIAARIYQRCSDGTYKTRLRYTTGMPPALIAQEFDFKNVAANRTVSRAKLDEYRADFAAARSAGAPPESVIFKY
jgi:hypothetical protein